MAKIKIGGVFSNGIKYFVNVVLTGTQLVEGEEVEGSLGEATISFDKDTEMADIKDMIVNAANGIMKAHKDSIDKGKDLEELELPEIT